MSDHEGSTTSVEVVLEQKEHSFLDAGIDLKRLLRDVSKQTKPAVEALVKLLESKDEKIRLTAATKLLELQVSVAKEVNEDNLKRLIAEVKLNSGGKKTLVDTEKENRPLVDFTTIREVD